MNPQRVSSFGTLVPVLVFMASAMVVGYVMGRVDYRRDASVHPLPAAEYLVEPGRETSATFFLVADPSIDRAARVSYVGAKDGPAWRVVYADVGRMNVMKRRIADALAEDAAVSGR